MRDTAHSSRSLAVDLPRDGVRADPHDAELGLVEHVKRPPFKVFRVLESELESFKLISGRSADAQSYCFFTAGLTLSFLTSMLTMPGAPETGPDPSAGQRLLILGLMIVFAVLSGIFARSWYRERNAALEAMTRLMKRVGSEAESE